MNRNYFLGGIVWVLAIVLFFIWLFINKTAETTQDDIKIDPDAYKILLTALNEVCEIDKMTNKINAKKIEDDEIGPIELFKKAPFREKFAEKIRATIEWIFDQELGKNYKKWFFGFPYNVFNQSFDTIPDYIKEFSIIWISDDLKPAILFPINALKIENIQEKFYKLSSQLEENEINKGFDEFFIPKRLIVFFVRASNVIPKGLVDENFQINFQEIILYDKKFKITHLFVFEDENVAFIGEGNVKSSKNMVKKISDIKNWRMSFAILSQN